MYTQDFELEVINDCYEIGDRQCNDFLCERQENGNEMDFLHRSAPNINGLRMNYMYGDEANDFVMNSCQNIGDYGHFLYDQPEDISYEESDDDRPFGSEDIFDRIEDLNLDDVNGSLLDETQQDCDEIIGNNSNFSLDRAFNFNLNPNSMKDKNTGVPSFTDRVSCSLLGISPHSRSQQKHKLGFIMNKNAQQINHSSLYDSVTFDPKGSMIKGNNHAQNKQKFQPFKDFIKQSNILCEILPSNDLNNSLILSKSMFLDTKDMKKSILLDNNLKLSEQKQRLLKKIDKLMFSKSNNKFHKKIDEKALENKQRRELKMRKFYVQEKDKENPKKIQLEKFTKITEQKLKKNAQPIQYESKIFKRSKNLKQNVQIKASMREKKKQNFGILEINKGSLGIQKKIGGKSTLKNAQNQSGKQVQKQKKFIYQEMTPSLINTLKGKLSAEAFEAFVGLDKVYKQSINFLGQSQKLATQIQEQQAVNSKASIFSSLKKDVDLKSQALEQQKKQLHEQIRCLESERLSLKKVLDSEYEASQECVKLIISGQKDSISNHPLQKSQHADSKQQNNTNIPFMYKNIAQKRQQMRREFDLWKEIGLQCKQH